MGWKWALNSVGCPFALASLVYEWEEKGYASKESDGLYGMLRSLIHSIDRLMPLLSIRLRALLSASVANRQSDPNPFAVNSDRIS